MKRIPLFLLFIGLMALWVFPFCNHGEEQEGFSKKNYSKDRTAMVWLLERYGVKNSRLLKAMAKIPRHEFIPSGHRLDCNPYGDHPCPIGYGQTISQPYIVAYMTEKMNLGKGEKVLEVGTGSGYQAAVLAELGANVYTIEIVHALADHARGVLKAQGYKNVHCLRGDGYKGWPAHAPFDAIIVTCAPDKVPPKLVEQLKEGGRMILPVGTWSQRLIILRKKKGKIIRENDLPVRFVPMVHGKN